MVADALSKAGLTLALGQWDITEHKDGNSQAFYHRPFINTTVQQQDQQQQLNFWLKSLHGYRDATKDNLTILNNLSLQKSSSFGTIHNFLLQIIRLKHLVLGVKF
jgi:hypothetical protein